VGNHDRRAREIPNSQQGYILLFAIFLLALLVIALALAAPDVAKSIQRDRELETYHRGLEYRRAIQLYYRKFNAYPPNIDALVQTNNIRFLRQKYIDPLTGKDDWKPILFGQNKAPTALGFFGQPLAGGATTVAGTGPGGGNGGGVLPGGISDIFGTPSSGASPTSPTSPTDNSGSSANPGAQPTDASGNPIAGGTNSTTASPTGSNQPEQTGQTGQSGQTFGGAGIIGFKPVSDKKSILLYKKKNHYNEWEFTYDPISDQQTMTGGNTGSPTGGNALPGSTINQNNLSGPPASTPPPNNNPTPPSTPTQ
jgi:type II secretory pathway pseudopilin PulG